ncbi:MAG: class I SAM-dependent methyltransferase [Nocardioidaceae bacterium]|nr:class I SAM-dependent methyltransferase [Nocardioidaceae bacterium]
MSSDRSVTADGCPIDVYAELPAAGEPEWIHAVVPAGASILDLGAGVGRIADPLCAVGHRVVAVDDSAEMLARVARAETVESRIETLRLDERFDVVLLASHLVNTADDDLRAGLLATVRSHLAPDGVALLEWHEPDWFDRLAVGPHPTGRIGPVSATLDVAAFDGDLLDASVTYELDGRRWTQPFTARRLTQPDLDRVLAQAGMERVAPNEPRSDWIVARPISCNGGS